MLVLLIIEDKIYKDVMHTYLTWNSLVPIVLCILHCQHLADKTKKCILDRDKIFIHLAKDLASTCLALFRTSLSASFIHSLHSRYSIVGIHAYYGLQCSSVQCSRTDSETDSETKKRNAKLHISHFR